MKRREFIDNIAKGTSFIVAIPLLSVSCQETIGDPTDETEDESSGNTITIDLTMSANSDLNSSGGYVIKNDVIVINNGGSFIALSSICTHTGCQVSFNKTENNIPCNCHGSLFDLQGSVLNGPASSPLKKYKVIQDGDLLIVDLD